MREYYKPLLGTRIRYIAGACILSALLLYVGSDSLAFGEWLKISIFAFFLWIASTFLTDKYTHKYPQRYLTYVCSTTLRAFALVYFLLFFVFLFGILRDDLLCKLLYTISLFLFADFLLSLLRTKQEEPDVRSQTDIFLKKVAPPSSAEKQEEAVSLRLNHAALLSLYEKKLPGYVLGLIKRNTENDETSKLSEGVLFIEDLPQLEEACKGNLSASCIMIVGQTALNNVKRLNSFLKEMAQALPMGGYSVVHYKPLEVELQKIREESSSFLYPLRYLKHFLWYRVLPKSRWLSKLYFSPPFAWVDSLRGSGQRRSMARAEAWGRLFFHGMEVLDETMHGEYAYVIAKKIAPPSTNAIPTYHSIVALYKMGLNGEMIRLHKIRSMYPFSEFLQKHIYQMHGLTNTGKFKNDFRLTEYGPFIRKYWIDEIPGIYDWLRGDVKLVGMRATSPHYLSLYPREVIELYFQVKPGLVPPIFDEKTTGFEQIVEIEKKYLESYIQNPVKTDILYFWYTFRDIFIRKVRSK